FHTDGKKKHTVETTKFRKLKERFVEKFGEPPLFYACAPGRVNLIGEHIDYCGYAVLPMAIEQSILAAVSVNDTQSIQLANVNPQYKDFAVSSEELQIDRTNPQWYYYYLCGVRGVKEHLGLAPLAGMKCVVDGTVPPSSGLSSSSALVCCAGLVTLEANNKMLSKVELAEICARCERYIGTEGGGMDQSISFLAEEGTAKLIEFNPLRAVDVKLPDGAVFVIANCCVEMNKAATSHFNIRVVECRLAAKLLAKRRGLDWSCVQRLKEVCQTLGVSLEQLRDGVLSANTQHVTHFKLHQRAQHVYSEAARVLRFREVCEAAPDDSIRQLGLLMQQSHTSCRDLYECSCPELDQLVRTCLKAGAVGSRLTGAGWGGCTVSMVPVDKLEAFLQEVRKSYYTSDPRRAALEKHSLFVTKPGGGAALFLEA
uniref:Galactokinase 2 n=1 Tax=Scleropages formosus TaxID=113540 RepID=A0A8D0C741_SCLFO